MMLLRDVSMLMLAVLRLLTKRLVTPCMLTHIHMLHMLPHLHLHPTTLPPRTPLTVLSNCLASPCMLTTYAPTPTPALAPYNHSHHARTQTKQAAIFVFNKPPHTCRYMVTEEQYVPTPTSTKTNVNRCCKLSASLPTTHTYPGTWSLRAVTTSACKPKISLGM